MSNTSTKPRVLLFSPFFYPENISTGRYNTYLALALHNAGNNVSAVCSYPLYPDWKVRASDVDDLREIQTFRGGARMWYPRSQVLRRLFLEVWYFFFAKQALRRLETQQYDVVIDIYPPNLFSLVSSRRRRLNAPVVGIVHDLQGVMSQTTSSLPRRIVGKLIRPIEKKALHGCDRLVFLSNAMMQFALDRYGLSEKKCSVAYPFQSLSGNDSIQTPAAISGHEKSLVYSGALSEKQAPEDLLSLMDAFARSNRDYGVFVFSAGPVFEILKAKYEASDSPVEFHGLVPDDELEGLLRSSTIQIIPQKLTVSHGAFPSKLPNLIQAGTAIFGVTDEGSEVDHILSRYSKGIAIHRWDGDVSVQALQNFADALATGHVDVSGSNDEELRDLFRVERLCDIIGEVTQTTEMGSGTRPEIRGGK